MAQAPWWTFPRIDNYGAPDPFGGFPKPDSNIQLPDGYPVTALLSGTVSGINSPTGAVPDWGAVVTIKLDNAINPIATHSAYLHLAGVAPGVALGSHINVGDLIGYSGGSLAAGTQKVPLGFALYNGDYYGFGPTWAQFLGSPALNMTPLLNAASGGQLGAIQQGNFASFSTGVGGITGVPTSFVSDWLSNPARIIKLIAGLILLAIGLYALILPQTRNIVEQGAKFAKNNLGIGE